MRTSALRALAGAVALPTALFALGSAPAAQAAPAPEAYAAPADGVFRMTGSGWGHGRGMSQWGAYQAAVEGVPFASILAFYYPGTVLAPLPAANVRVLLSGDTGRDLVVRATPGMVVQRAGADPVALPEQPEGCAAPATRWRARAVGAGLRLDVSCGGRWRTVQGAAPAAITFAGADGMVATQNGTVRRAYRGTVTATRLGSRAVQVVNTVAMEEYLRAVVPSESSPSWPDEALKAQAVAARSYAAREARGRAGRSFDVYDTTRSQAYPGAAILDSAWRPVRSREHPRSDAAIAATSGLFVTVDGAPALTQFSASNGGATAASPLPYMTVQADPWDSRAGRNPRLAWTDSISTALLARRAGVGQVTAVEVLGREGAGQWGGRITALRIVGTKGARTISGDGAIRSIFGTASSMFTFTAAPVPAPAS